MCGPVEILMGVGTAVQTIGALREGQAASAAARANATAAEQDAVQERRIGAFNVARERREQRRATAQNVARAGSQGAALTGQPIDLLADSVRQQALDREAIRFEAETGARRLERRAELDRFDARRRREAGFVRAGTALLSGASRIGRRFNRGSTTTGDEG